MIKEFEIETRIGDFIGSSRHDYGRGPIEILAYKVEHISGDFILNDHEEIRGVTPWELEGYDFVKADRAIVTKLNNDV